MEISYFRIIIYWYIHCNPVIIKLKVSRSDYKCEYDFRFQIGKRYFKYLSDYRSHWLLKRKLDGKFNFLIYCTLRREIHFCISISLKHCILNNYRDFSPEIFACERSTSLNSTLEKSISERSVPLRFAPINFAPISFAPISFAPVSFAPARFAPENIAPERSAPVRSTSLRSASLKFAPMSFALLRNALRRFALLRFAPDRSVSTRLAPIRLAPVKFMFEL